MPDSTHEPSLEPLPERALFLLTRDLRPRRSGLEMTFWGASSGGPVCVRLTQREAVFFVERGVETRAGRRAPVELATMAGAPVDAVYFRDRRAMRAEAERLRALGTPPHEADVKPADRVLMERFITGGCVARGGRAIPRDGYLEVRDPTLVARDVEPRLRVASIDVEAEGPDGALISVAIVMGEHERVFARSERETPIDGVSFHPTERGTLEAFLAHVRELDPDVLIGWNVVDFDVSYLEARCRVSDVPFALGRGRRTARVLRGSRPGAPPVARVPGRVVLDGIATMRAATWSFERWSLEHVSRTLLGRGKRIAHDEGEGGDRLQEILRMYREDLPALLEYNLEDCRLVRDIFARAHVLEFAIERQRLTGLTMDRRAGAVAAFDHLYLPRLHREGRVAPSTGSESGAAASPGGYVMDSVPGIHEHVVVMDFKSLYPSIIRTFRVDPLALALAEELPETETVPGFAGGRFARERHILPGVIETLWSARDEAKRRGDAALSRAIKIQMNSFYGVLGTPACRFFDPRLATSITRRGHEILRRTRRLVEARGHRVIYGDTDSVFVVLAGVGAEDVDRVAASLAEDVDARLTEQIEDEYGLRSALELEVETHFLRFLMPTTRRSEAGSKKRYAGITRAPDGSTRLVIKGLEAVRTDWTPLARRVQRELLRRVFAGEPFEGWLGEVSAALFRGELDAELVYQKRIRRALDEYRSAVPPHIAAARQLDAPVREIAYVITRRGPQPVSRQTASLDYDHYLERQLAPAADVVLPLLGSSFMRIGGRQLSLF